MATLSIKFKYAFPLVKAGMVMKVREKGLTIKETESKESFEIMAWVHDLMPDKRTIVLRDPTGIKEFLVDPSVVKGLTRESLVKAKGYVHSGESIIKDIEVIIKAPPKLPIDVRNPPADDPERFSRYSYLVIRSPKYMKVLKIQQWILYGIRDFLISKGFIELLPPIISPCSDPGLRGAKKLRTKLYGKEYELMSSLIMFKQAAASALGKIFFVGRNVREEPPEHLSTGRHLCEFTQIDVELAFAKIDDAMRLCEDLLKYTIGFVWDKCRSELEELNPSLEIPRIPFKVLTYDEAFQILKEMGEKVVYGKEFPQDSETKLATSLGEPIWIIKYPIESRGFYYMPDQEDPGKNRDFNLILPKGYGEVIDGGEREYRYEKIVERIKLMGEDPDHYGWFLDLAKIGIAPSCGFGIGLERLTRYIAGLKYIWEAVPFPKVPGVAPTP